MKIPPVGSGVLRGIGEMDGAGGRNPLAPSGLCSRPFQVRVMSSGSRKPSAGVTGAGEAAIRTLGGPTRGRRRRRRGLTVAGEEMCRSVAGDVGLPGRCQWQPSLLDVVAPHLHGQSLPPAARVAQVRTGEGDAAGRSERNACRRRAGRESFGCRDFAARGGAGVRTGSVAARASRAGERVHGTGSKELMRSIMSRRRPYLARAWWKTSLGSSRRSVSISCGPRWTIRPVFTMG